MKVVTEGEHRSHVCFSFMVLLLHIFSHVHPKLQNPGGPRRTLEDLGGPRRTPEDPGGHGRTWEDPGGLGRSWEDLGGHERTDQDADTGVGPQFQEASSGTLMKNANRSHGGSLDLLQEERKQERKLS